jgi:hypothetical protein
MSLAGIAAPTDLINVVFTRTYPASSLGYCERRNEGSKVSLIYKIAKAITRSLLESAATASTMIA